MARTAAARIDFVEVEEQRTSCARGVVRMYAVEVRRGRTRYTLGRVSGLAGSWEALPVGASACKRRHTTRKAALRALLAREDFRDNRTWTGGDDLLRWAVGYSRALVPMAGAVRTLPRPAADAGAAAPAWALAA